MVMHCQGHHHGLNSQSIVFIRAILSKMLLFDIRQLIFNLETARGAIPMVIFLSALTHSTFR